MDHSEDEMTERLVNRLSDLVTQIVLILLARVKNLKGDDRPRDDPRLIEFCRTIRLALDHCRLDQQVSSILFAFPSPLRLALI